MIKVGIIGAAGYTGGELLRLLAYHPEVEIVFVQSNSQAGKPIWHTHADLEGVLDLTYSPSIITGAEVWFLCMAHGQAKNYLQENPVPEGVKVIDLSNDFRLNRGKENPFVYGLPESYKEEIIKAKFIANPGCFATCIQLGLLPLAAEKLLSGDVHVNATTGSTGAGQSLSETSHFSWRESNFSVYKAFSHQHEAEILETLKAISAGSNSPTLYFIPNRGNFTRGIWASIYCDMPDLSITEVKELYQRYYQSHPFVQICEREPSLKQVVNTNRNLIYLQEIKGKLLIFSMLDNLLKGASGQAVENMNLMFGLDRSTGLKLKAQAF